VIHSVTEKTTTPHVPVSWGELIDKITILQIKRERLESQTALANVKRELDALSVLADPVLAGDAEANAVTAKLKAVNESLWDIEDRIRAKESAKAFDAEFIELARSVYIRNDERAALKKQLNIKLASELTEEKSYKPY
jgi:hypothetical protein